MCTGRATSCSDKSLRVYWKIFVKIFVSETEFCRCNKSQKIMSDWICATCCGNKILLQLQRFSQKFSSTHGAICRCNVSLRHVAATCRLVCTDLHVVVGATTAKKWTKKAWCTCRVVILPRNTWSSRFLSARQIAQNQKLSKTFFHKKACRNTYDEGRRWETDLALRIWRFHGESVRGSLMRERFVCWDCTQSPTLLCFK